MNANKKPQQERRRRLLSGRTVPATEPRRTWNELVAPGPKPTGCASLKKKHPSYKHRGDVKPRFRPSLRSLFRRDGERAA